MEPMRLDGLTADLGGLRTTAFLARGEKLIPWQTLADSMADWFPKDTDCSRGGRPHWPLVSMLKCLMLVKWFGLADPQWEEMPRERLSLRRFVGLSLAEATPEETTFVVFRKRPRQSGHVRTLLEATRQCLREQNLRLQEGTLVDATISEAPLGRKRADGTMTTDPAADKTSKGGRAYHGFKAHVATDKRGIIKDDVFTLASVSAHEPADHRMRNETQEREFWITWAFLASKTRRRSHRQTQTNTDQRKKQGGATPFLSASVCGSFASSPSSPWLV